MTLNWQSLFRRPNLPTTRPPDFLNRDLWRLAISPQTGVFPASESADGLPHPGPKSNAIANSRGFIEPATRIKSNQKPIRRGHD
jgi:hypothetical protein